MIYQKTLSALVKSNKRFLIPLHRNYEILKEIKGQNKWKK